jgi:hypothetical protein
MERRKVLVHHEHSNEVLADVVGFGNCAHPSRRVGNERQWMKNRSERSR